jgi:hypothetical protein
MKNRIPWLDRQFPTDLPSELLPYVVERLRGTPIRVNDRVLSLSRELLVHRDGDSWSIQENIGHLLDVENLWHGRLDDFAVNLEVLRPADLENQRTFEADHNSRSLDVILSGFREARMTLVERLEFLEDAAGSKTALHPRLNSHMKIVDLMYFAAEHDDHHLARISELLALFE